MRIIREVRFVRCDGKLLPNKTPDAGEHLIQIQALSIRRAAVGFRWLALPCSAA